jgi:hypothetical protein
MLHTDVYRGAGALNTVKEALKMPKRMEIRKMMTFLFLRIRQYSRIFISYCAKVAS